MLRIFANAFPRSTTEPAAIRIHRDSHLPSAPLALLAIAGCEEDDDYNHSYDVGMDSSNNGTPDVSTQPQNRPPAFGPLPDLSVNEGETLNFTVPITDPDGDELQLSLLDGFYDNPDGILLKNVEGFYVLEWTPEWTYNHTQVGDYRIGFRLSDGETTVDAEIKITVREVQRDPRDKDGDGFISDVDCDDNDPDTYPLRDNQTLNVTRDTNICSGIYKGAKISLSDVSGITLRAIGAAVLLDGSNLTFSGQYGDQALRGVITLDNVENSIVSGFALFAYDIPYVGLLLDNSNGNTIEDIEGADMPGGDFYLRWGSSNNTIRNYRNLDVIQCCPVLFRTGVEISGSNNRILNYLLQGEFPNPLFPFAISILRGRGNVIRDGEAFSGFFVGEQATGTQILNNRIKDVYSGRNVSHNGVTSAGDNTTISGNTITGFGRGISIEDSSNNNVITNNNLCGSREDGLTVDPASSGNTVANNQCQ